MLRYQPSSTLMVASRAIASRYRRTLSLAANSVSARVRPAERPATTALAARRSRSHSHGPRNVSSKSFRSNMSVRSGEE